MESILVNESKENFFINSIQLISPHVLQINFSETIPEEFGDITVLTTGGNPCATLKGFNTIYKKEDNIVYLSDDESVYTEPTYQESTESIPSVEYKPTLQELITAKKTEINNTCNSLITSGVDVVLSDDELCHFNLKEEDQMAFLLCSMMVANGQEFIPWHANSSDDTTIPCKYYSNEDMKKITETVTAHISYHQTYTNSLKVWLDHITTEEELNTIYYGITIPEEYQSDVLKSFLSQNENQ